MFSLSRAQTRDLYVHGQRTCRNSGWCTGRSRVFARDKLDHGTAIRGKRMNDPFA